MTVKHLLLEYNKLNERGTFSPGDVLSGKVTVVTNKETKVQRFLVRAKGKAEVTWDMPSSYEGKWGKITYSLRAQLTQSIWLVHKTKMEFPFLTKSEFPFASRSETMIIGLKEQQSATTISFYGLGKVTMNVISEKMGVKQGEAMGVSVEVLNDSARTVTPKFYLCEKQTFVAQSKRTVHTDDVLFGTGDSVPAQTSRVVTKVLSIPPQTHPTFLNCCLMKLEYRIKVTLDVPLARDPEIKLPLVVLQGSPKPHQQKPKRSIWFRKLPG
ncbi:unnamed protein product [Pleuronectes platessa]|uniref:Arrestin C-terminal-like domain-containing protein n=1 Tax=Pleuronectes platessa TaxID=8262 RepID=A0A9N7VC91_PLEPL|nr:unnamed protein product [Pleuronectes platessa]